MNLELILTMLGIKKEDIEYLIKRAEVLKNLEDFYQTLLESLKVINRKLDELCERLK